MKYYLVIVNYNNSNVTISCVLSTEKLLENQKIEIVIVDNNSKEQDVDNLKKFIQENKNLDVKLLSLNDNIGYFPAINQGIISLNLSQKKDYFLIIGNNDLVFPPEFIQSLERLIVNEDIFIISPDIVTAEGIHQNPHVIKRISRFRRLIYRLYFSSYQIALFLDFIGQAFSQNRRGKSRHGYDKEQYIKMGFGACYILLPNFIQKVGLLDESIFLMGEEALLSNQVYSNGGKILYTPQIQVIHQDHSTFKKMPLLHEYNITRKSYLIYKKYL